MSDDSQIRGLIQGGETPQVEFKSSFRFDFREQKVNKELTKVVAKTIAGFMNSEGGALIMPHDIHAIEPSHLLDQNSQRNR
jgi:hypothetical protein